MSRAPVSGSPHPDLDQGISRAVLAQMDEAGAVYPAGISPVRVRTTSHGIAAAARQGPR